MAFLFNLNICLATYLLLTAGSGDFLYFWSVEEFISGAAVSIIIAALTCKIVPDSISRHINNPFRWIALVIYMTIPFFFSLFIANAEVIYRVITGKISPAVIKMETGYKSSVGTFFLANSITLSPGTLTLEMDESDNSLYIHCLAWDKGDVFKPNDVAPFIYYWLKKIYG